MARDAAHLDLVPDSAPRARNYPTVPPYDGLTNSPGIELAFRLPPAQSPGWQLLAMTIFALLWTGMSCVLLVWAIRSHVAARPEWFLTVFLLPLWAVAAWSVRHLSRLIWLHTGMGLTTLEISEHPLIPGREYQVSLSQHGQIAVKSLEVWLVCEEEATYRQGTDIRTEIRRVHQQRVSSHADFRIEPIAPFQASIVVPIPPAAMHSFHSPHNSVNWKLVVRGEVAHWPPFERGFPIVVYPGESTLRVEVSASALRNAQRTPEAAAPAGATA
jgi:hypothetical protein